MTETGAGGTAAPEAARDPAGGHPVVRLAARLDAALPWTSVVAGHAATGRSWVRCSDVLDGGVPAWFAHVTDVVTRQQGGRVPPAVVPTAYLMGWYLDVPATVGGLAFGLVRQVPELAPDALALHRHPGGWADGTALLGRRFACLPDDPDAGHPDADVVDDEAALAGVLRERVVAHARAFHAVYDTGVKAGSRQRWGMVSDLLEAAVLSAGLAGGDEAAGVADARLVLDGAEPLPAARSYRLVDARGRERWGRRRASCCFMFRLPGLGTCTTCPRIGDVERAERLTRTPS